jgi:hypothetical protein
MPKAKEKPETVEETASTDMVSIQERIKSRLAKVNETTTAPASSKISTKGMMFTLPDGKSSAGPLNCVVLDYTNMNTYYEAAYVEGQYAEPDCMAVGREIKSMAPSDTVTNKQSDACDICPKNEFGSKGRGKACQNKVLLAILPEDFTEESEVYSITVSATGLKDWSSYVRQLQSQGIDPMEVVTSLSFKEGVTYPSLKFRAIGTNARLEDVSPFLPKADTLLASAA